MFLNKQNILNFLKVNWHAVIFSILGLFITGLPIASAKSYICYVIGMVLVWTIPAISCVFRKYLAAFLATILVVAKGYYIYLQPKLEVQVFPILTYQNQLIVKNSLVSDALLDNLSKRFKKSTEVSEISPIAKPEKFSEFNYAVQPIILELLYSYRYLDLVDAWGTPSNITSLMGLPVVLSMHVVKPGKAVFYAQGNFYLNNSNGGIDSLIGDGKIAYELERFEGKTFFFPFINAQDSNWLYIGVWEYGAYLPFVLLIFAFLLCAWESLQTSSQKFITHMTAIGISITVVLLENLNNLYMGSASVPVKNYEFYNGMFGGVSDHFNFSPLWFVINKFFKGIIDISMLLPLLCIYFASLTFLQVLKKLFTEKTAYIVWAILLATPLLMFYNFGLHTFRFLLITHNPLLLGMPLFLYGLCGYLDKFKNQHGVVWLLASLCHPMLGVVVCALLFHKHLPKQRYIYLVLCACIYLFFVKNILFDSGNIFDNPFTKWLLITMKFGAKNTYSLDAINYLSRSYSVLLVIFALIPNVIVALFAKSTVWRLFARAVIIMHIMWFFDGTTSDDLFLASTLSAVAAIHFYQQFFERYSVKYAKLAAACK
jgi:hypothetical protein